MTWADLLAFTREYVPREAKVNPSLYGTLANFAIDQINLAVGGVEIHLTNDAADLVNGLLSLSGNACTSPISLQEIRQVYWVGTPLTVTTEDRLTAQDSAWRTRPGTPSQYVPTSQGLYLDCDPGTGDDGSLELWGYGSIPHFDSALPLVNPFAYLTQAGQNGLLLYVVGYLPAHFEDKKALEAQAFVALQADFRKQWADALPQVSWTEKLRKYPQLSG